MNNDNFNQIYFNQIELQNIIKQHNNIIQQQYHRRPLLGWNADKFSKVITKMLIKALKPGFFNKRLVNDLDDFFINKNIFSFQNLLKEKPDVTANGNGKNLVVILRYREDINNPEQFLVGEKMQKASQKKGLFAKMKSFFSSKNKQGILFNPTFFKDFEEKYSFDSSNLDEDQLVAYGGENASQQMKDIIALKNAILGDGLSVQLILQFNNLKYIDNLKPKQSQYFNPNRVNSFSGNIFLKFNDKVLINIGNGQDKAITWNQLRTSNMDPPKPIKDQIREIWKDPQNHGYGALGLATKKLGSALQNLALGGHGIGVEKIQDESFDVSLNQAYSMSKMKNVAANDVKDDDQMKSVTAIINNVFKNYGIFKVENIEKAEQKNYIVTFKYNDKDLTLSIELK